MLFHWYIAGILVAAQCGNWHAATTNHISTMNLVGMSLGYKHWVLNFICISYVASWMIDSR